MINRIHIDRFVLLEPLYFLGCVVRMNIPDSMTLAMHWRVLSNPSGFIKMFGDGK